ncbi:immunoglobulin superfamily DCC subclass member 4 isoform X3 [Scyliorhinus torazame]|uniref:immunoglobulin superfamily DCC subclass member 4 isoform X3 n=1 Tax=Scyliorhinus torazame TaxID=75743 RepID=UPI003B5BFE9A
MALGRLCWHRVLAWILTVILSEDKVNSLNLSCSVGPVHVVLQPNQTVVLDCNLPAVDQPANMTWKKGGIPVVDQEPHHIFPNGSLHISDVPRDSINQDGGSSEGSYTCMAQNSFGAITSRTALIRFSTLSRFHQQPESQVVEENGIARFECGIIGLPLPVVTWEKNQSAIPNHVRFIVLPNGILQIVDVQVDDAGVYRCIATNSVRKRYSQDATLTVLKGFKSVPGDLVIIAHPKNVTVISGQTAIMECLAYADPTPFVSWIRQGTNNVEYQFAVNNDTTELQVKDLQPNTNYTFYVVAYSQLGASRTSHSMIVQTMEDVPSTAPQLSLSIPTLTDIRVTWLPLSPELSHGKITKYRIDYCTLIEDQIYSIEVDGNETQVTLPTVQSKKIYKVRIAASTTMGYGAPSEWTQHLIPERNKLIMVPFAPTEMKVKTTVDSLLVTWQPPSNQVQIQGYKLYYREAGVDDSSKELSESNNEEHWTKGPIRLRRKVKQYEITGLVSDKLYEIKLIAFNKQDDGYAAVWKGKTEKAPALTLDLPVMLPPPTQLRAESNSSRAIWLHWTRPPFTTVQIVNYTIRCSPSGLKNASLVTYFTSSEEEIFITSLKPYTRYEFAVQSHGIGVDGPFSGIVEGLTLSDKPSTPPSDMKLNPINAYSVRVRWLPPTEPNGIIVEYIILYNANYTQPDDRWNSLSKEGHIFSTDVQGLESDTRYFFKMGAKTVVGTGPYSTTKDVQTLPKRILGLHDLLDIHSVTGIIVGVCLGLLCILFCICASFCNNKRREGSSGPDSHLTTEHAHYRRARKASSTHSIAHPHAQELETLMTTPAEDLSLSTKLTELTEVQIFMDNRLPDDGIQLKLKSAWNGSIHHKWANDAICYSSAILPDSACKKNEPLRLNPDTSEDDLHGKFVFNSILGTARKEHPPSGFNCVEAEVIVHSELSASERNSTCEDQDWQSKEDLQVRPVSASSTDLHSEYIPMLSTEAWKRKKNLEIECTAVVPAEDWNEDAQSKCALALPAKENQSLEICKNSLSAVANEVMNCIEAEKHRDVTEPQDNLLLHSKTKSSKVKTAESHGFTNGFQSIEGWKSSVNGFTLKNRNSESSYLKNTETLSARCQPLLTGEDVAANHFIASSITTTSASEKDLCP